MPDVAPRRADRELPQRNAELLDLLARGQNLLHALFPVGLEKLCRDFPVVRDAHVHHVLARVGKNRFDVVSRCITVRLAVLRHDVEHIALERLRAGDRSGNAVDEKVRDDACVKTAGSQDDHVRVRDGL